MIRNTVFIAITCIAIVSSSSFSAAESGQVEKDKRVDLDKIPIILKIEGQIVNFRDPQTFMFNGVKNEINQVIEYHIKTEEPVVARATDPVLVIDDRLVTTYRYSKSEPNVIIFTDLEPEKMTESQKIRFQWGKRTVLPKKDNKVLNFFIIEKKNLTKITR